LRSVRGLNCVAALIVMRREKRRKNITLALSSYRSFTPNGTHFQSTLNEANTAKANMPCQELKAAINAGRLLRDPPTPGEDAPSPKNDPRPCSSCSS